MSTQVNQFLMWAIHLPYEWHEQWEGEHDDKDFYESFASYMDDSAFESEVKHRDGIFCLFDGRDGRFIFLGRVIQKAKHGDLLGEGAPLDFPPLTDLEQELIANSVERVFGVKGEFKHWLVTQLR